VADLLFLKLRQSSYKTATEPAEFGGYRTYTLRSAVIKQILPSHIEIEPHIRSEDRREKTKEVLFKRVGTDLALMFLVVYGIRTH
jgi:hypothetical protein